MQLVKNSIYKWLFICSCLVKYFTTDLNNMQAEGIFRINADNRQEEYLRDQLNKGVVPEDIDVHCLAGLIKVLQWRRYVTW